MAQVALEDLNGSPVCRIKLVQAGPLDHPRQAPVCRAIHGRRSWAPPALVSSKDFRRTRSFRLMSGIPPAPDDLSDSSRDMWPRRAADFLVLHGAHGVTFALLAEAHARTRRSIWSGHSMAPNDRVDRG